MAAAHPHAAATYRVVQQKESYGVEVSVPETCPTIVSGFASQEQAESWLADHKRQTDQNIASGRPPFRLARKRWPSANTIAS